MIKIGIFLFLAQITNMTIVNQETENPKEKLMMEIPDDTEIELSIDVYSKYHFFEANVQFDNFLFKSNVEKNKTKHFNSGFEIQMMKKFVELNSNDPINELSLNDFFYLIEIINFYQIKDEFKDEIYGKLIASALKNKIFHQPWQNIDQMKKSFYSVKENVFDIYFWHLLFNEALKSFGMGLEKAESELKITPYATSYTTKKFKEINELVFYSLIPYKPQQNGYFEIFSQFLQLKNYEKEDFDIILSNIKFCLEGLLNNTDPDNNLKKLTFKNKFLNEDFHIFSEIFENKLEKIRIINFDLLCLEIESEEFIQRVEKFFNNFPNLEELEIKISPFMKSESLENFFNIESVSQKITSLTFLYNNMINGCDCAITSNFTSLRYLEVLNANINLESLFKNNTFKNSLQELILKNITISVESGKYISKLKNLKKLHIDDCNLNQNGSILFDGKNLKKSLKFLILKNTRLSSDQAKAISDFKNLEKLVLNLTDITPSYESFYTILSSEKLQNSVKELTLGGVGGKKPYTYNSHLKLTLNFESFISKFHKLENLVLLGCHIENSGILEILDNEIFRKTLTSLTLSSPRNFIDNFFPELEVLEKLDMFEVYFHGEIFKKVLNNTNFQRSLTELNASYHYFMFPEEFLDNFLSFKSLTKLKLPICDQNIDFVNNVLNCKNFHESIRVLHLNGNLPNINQVHFEDLSKFKKLEELVVKGEEFDQESLLRIFSCKNLQKTLKTLFLEKISINEQNVEKISMFEKLETFSLNYCGFSSEAVHILFKSENFKNSVSELIINNCNKISSVHISDISLFKRLQKLNVRFCDLKLGELDPIFKNSNALSTLVAIYVKGNPDLERSIFLRKMFEDAKILMLE